MKKQLLSLLLSSLLVIQSCGELKSLTKSAGIPTSKESLKKAAKSEAGNQSKKEMMAQLEVEQEEAMKKLGNVMEPYETAAAEIKSNLDAAQAMRNQLEEQLRKLKAALDSPGGMQSAAEEAIIKKALAIIKARVMKELRYLLDQNDDVVQSLRNNIEMVKNQGKALAGKIKRVKRDIQNAAEMRRAQARTAKKELINKINQLEREVKAKIRIAENWKKKALKTARDLKAGYKNIIAIYEKNSRQIMRAFSASQGNGRKADIRTLARSLTKIARNFVRSHEKQIKKIVKARLKQEVEKINQELLSLETKVHALKAEMLANANIIKNRLKNKLAELVDRGEIIVKNLKTQVLAKVEMVDATIDSVKSFVDTKVNEYQGLINRVENIFYLYATLKEKSSQGIKPLLVAALKSQEKNIETIIKMVLKNYEGDIKATQKQIQSYQRMASNLKRKFNRAKSDIKRKWRAKKQEAREAKAIVLAAIEKQKQNLSEVERTVKAGVRNLKQDASRIKSQASKIISDSKRTIRTVQKIISQISRKGMRNADSELASLRKVLGVLVKKVEAEIGNPFYAYQLRLNRYLSQLEKDILAMKSVLPLVEAKQAAKTIRDTVEQGEAFILSAKSSALKEFQQAKQKAIAVKVYLKNQYLPQIKEAIGLIEKAVQYYSAIKARRFGDVKGMVLSSLADHDTLVSKGLKLLMEQYREPIESLKAELNRYKMMGEQAKNQLEQAINNARSSVDFSAPQVNECKRILNNLNISMSRPKAKLMELKEKVEEAKTKYEEVKSKILRTKNKVKESIQEIIEMVGGSGKPDMKEITSKMKEIARLAGDRIEKEIQSVSNNFLEKINTLEENLEKNVNEIEAYLVQTKNYLENKVRYMASRESKRVKEAYYLAQNYVNALKNQVLPHIKREKAKVISIKNALVKTMQEYKGMARTANNTVLIAISASLNNAKNKILAAVNTQKNTALQIASDAEQLFNTQKRQAKKLSRAMKKIVSLEKRSAREINGAVKIFNRGSRGWERGAARKIQRATGYIIAAQKLIDRETANLELGQEFISQLESNMAKFDSSVQSIKTSIEDLAGFYSEDMMNLIKQQTISTEKVTGPVRDLTAKLLKIQKEVLNKMAQTIKTVLQAQRESYQSTAQKLELAGLR